MAAKLIEFAAEGKKRKLVSLLKKGVHVDAANERGESALFHAARNGQIATTRALLKRGADPHKRTLLGHTAIVEASRNNHSSCVSLLIQHGASIMPRSRPKVLELPKDTSKTDCIPAAQLFQAHFSNIRLTAYRLFRLLSANWNGTEVSVKTPLADSLKGWQAREEAEKLRSLRHPDILLAFGWSSSTPGKSDVLVFESINIGTIASIIDKNQEKIPAWDRVHLLLSVANAVQFLQQKGINHNFINSESVYVIEKWRCKLGNFEFATKETASRVSLTPVAFLHQLAYMAPEVVVAMQYNDSSDIHSFGALVWEVLARKRPWSWLSDVELGEKCMFQTSLQLPIHHRWPKSFQAIIKWSTTEQTKHRINISYCIQLLTELVNAQIDARRNECAKFPSSRRDNFSHENINTSRLMSISPEKVESMYVKMSDMQAKDDIRAAENLHQATPRKRALYSVPPTKTDPAFGHQSQLSGTEPHSASKSKKQVDILQERAKHTKTHSLIRPKSVPFLRDPGPPQQSLDNTWERYARAVKSSSEPNIHTAATTTTQKSCPQGRSKLPPQIVQPVNSIHLRPLMGGGSLCGSLRSGRATNSGQALSKPAGPRLFTATVSDYRKQSNPSDAELQDRKNSHSRMNIVDTVQTVYAVPKRTKNQGEKPVGEIISSRNPRSPGSTLDVPYYRSKGVNDGPSGSKKGVRLEGSHGVGESAKSALPTQVPKNLHKVHQSLTGGNLSTAEMACIASSLGNSEANQFQGNDIESNAVHDMYEAGNLNGPCIENDRNSTEASQIWFSQGHSSGLSSSQMQQFSPNSLGQCPSARLKIRTFPYMPPYVVCHQYHCDAYQPNCGLLSCYPHFSTSHSSKATHLGDRRNKKRIRQALESSDLRTEPTRNQRELLDQIYAIANRHKRKNWAIATVRHSK